MSALHEDLLFKIFLEDTYAGPHFPFFQHRRQSPLTTARHCSQVCRQWRSIFLSSSLIWGRLIDLNGLKETTDTWRNEIFARTGDGVLWVYGSVDNDVWGFLSPFIQQNWRRVQILIIRDINTGTSLDLQQKRWVFMKEPAPQLRRIEIQRGTASIDGPPTTSLFGDDAPLLKDFSMKHKFPTNASWMSNLSSISFPSSFKIDEVLTTLRRMPRLEYLSLVLPTVFGIPQVRQEVVLPNLRMLKSGHANVRETCFLLECITPSPDCCLAVQKFWNPAQDHGENKQYENAVKSYIMPYFCLRPPSALRFSVELDFLVLEDPMPLILRYPWMRCFRTVLDISFLHSSSLMEELINAPWLPSINKLEFYAMNFSKYHSAQNIAIVISALDAFSSSTTILHTNDDTLRRLLRWAVSYTSTLFPDLITLSVNCPWRYPPTEEEPPHHGFLKLRKAIGRPVSVLDFGVLSDDPGDLGYLEEHVGLLVKWETRDGHRREYFCGEGHPERLRFSRLY